MYLEGNDISLDAGDTVITLARQHCHESRALSVHHMKAKEWWSLVAVGSLSSTFPSLDARRVRRLFVQLAARMLNLSETLLLQSLKAFVGSVLGIPWTVTHTHTHYAL